MVCRPALLTFLIAAAFFSPAAPAENNVLFIVDASGSMKKLVDGQKRMDVAKKVLGETLGGMPQDARLGLLVYGHRKAKDCGDIELLAPIGGDDAAAIGKQIRALTPKGETPIAESLRRSIKSFNAFKGQQNSIVLVTDGIEECKGDPCAAARELKDAGLEVKVNIVGFTLGEAEGKALQCVADVTGGTYYSAGNAAGLTQALAQVQKEVRQTAIVQTAQPPAKDDNLLAARNGGALLSAPNDEWQKLNDGKPERATTYGGEGIWSFKDGKPATFEQFEVLIPAASGYNLKDFELLVGDEATGAFRSIGVFATQNVKMMPEGWQGFKFPPVTARFLKVHLQTDHGGGYIAAHEFKLVGKIDEAAPGAGKPTVAAGIDILAAGNGGTLVFAPNDKWQTINTDKFQGPTYGGEGVWSFKDGKPATFDRLEVLVTQSSQYNLKDFELFAADDSPTGQFRSIGAFTTRNVKAMPDGWQVFTFAPVTAKYLKVQFKSDHGGGYIRGHALRLFGKIDDAAQSVAKPAAAAGADLLAQAQGGMLLVAPNEEWRKLNDGLPERATTYKGEGVWAFRDEKPAVIERIDVLIPASSGYNLKEFEVLVGEEGPTGTFRSLGTFTTQNVKVMPEGYQSFSFPAMQAKYVKIVLKSDHGGGYIAAHEFKIFGKLAP
ncbi:MAG TPA: VWA domain-containing protein [Methylococcaceae bacterium]|nr:VWA domain-containing protein [Methylococcaceae bacterium]